jgi:hypothetical protein
MEAVRTSETPVDNHFTRQYNPEDSSEHKAYKLTLNFGKRSFVKFCTDNNTCVNVDTEYDDKTIEEVETTKFLVLQVDSNVNRKMHIQYIMPKLSSACFAMRTVTSLMKT